MLWIVLTFSEPSAQNPALRWQAPSTCPVAESGEVNEPTVLNQGVNNLFRNSGPPQLDLRSLTTEFSHTIGWFQWVTHTACWLLLAEVNIRQLHLLSSATERSAPDTKVLFYSHIANLRCWPVVLQLHFPRPMWQHYLLSQPQPGQPQPLVTS